MSQGCNFVSHTEILHQRAGDTWWLDSAHVVALSGYSTLGGGRTWLCAQRWLMTMSAIALMPVSCSERTRSRRSASDPYALFRLYRSVGRYLRPPRAAHYHELATRISGEADAICVYVCVVETNCFWQPKHPGSTLARYSARSEWPCVRPWSGVMQGQTGPCVWCSRQAAP